MSIDDKLHQAETLVRIDEAHRSPRFARLVRRIAEGFATGGAIGACAAFSEGLSAEAADFSTENSAYLLSIVIEEVKRLSGDFDHLSQEHRDFLNQDWVGLLVDGDCKARATRVRARVARIARILSNSAKAGPSQPADDVEELMNVAMALRDRDVLILQAIDGSQHARLRDGRVSRMEAIELWNAAAIIRQMSLTSGDLESACSRLQSFGLLRTAEDRRANNLADQPIAYGLLEKGHSFITFIRSNDT